MAMGSTVVTAGPPDTPIPLPDNPLCGPTASMPPPSVTADRSEEPPLFIFADEARGDRGTLLVEGEVRARRGEQAVDADRMRYRHRAETLSAEGSVRFALPGLVAESRHLELQRRPEHARAEGVHYELLRENARGDATVLEMEGRSLIRLQEVSYTTCKGARPDWTIRAERVELDREAGEGTARDATLRVRQVPVLWLPWFSFPLDDRRKSGFLTPEVGFNSSNGTTLGAPWYWNIAPDRDATFTPRLITRRGLQLRNEFRWLTPTSTGQAQFDWLPGDRLAGEDRVLLAIRDHSQFNRNWKAEVKIDHVSDPYYLQDLGSTLTSTATRQLEQRADLRYNAPWWNVLARLQRYQPLVDTPETYGRLPQLQFNALVPWGGDRVTLQMYGEAVRFSHAEDVEQGSRIDLKPAVGLDLRGAAWFLRPRLAMRLTAWRLDESDAEPVRTRGLPILSADSGLFFERSVRLRGNDYLQTLEPRLYYLYVPYRDQDELPRFDSSLLDFSFAQMFRDNRFSGADRQGDANQVSAALTSRLLRDDTGEEWLRLSLGQILYLDDRRVTLDGTPDTESGSPLVAEAQLNLEEGLTLRSGLQWDPFRQRTEKAVAELRYRRDAGHIFNLAYRSNRDKQLELADLSFWWPLARGWQAMGRWEYSLEEQTTSEAFAGIQYGRCCWKVRLVGRRYLGRSQEQTEPSARNAIYLQVELTGFTRLGDDVDRLLGQGILGYRPDGHVQ